MKRPRRSPTRAQRKAVDRRRRKAEQRRAGQRQAKATLPAPPSPYDGEPADFDPDNPDDLEHDVSEGICIGCGKCIDCAGHAEGCPDDEDQFPNEDDDQDDEPPAPAGQVPT